MHRLSVVETDQVGEETLDAVLDGVGRNVLAAAGDDHVLGVGRIATCTL